MTQRLHGGSLFLLVVWAWWWRAAGVEAGLTQLHLTVATPDGKNFTKAVDVDKESLKVLGVTQEDLEATLMQADASGKVDTGGQDIVAIITHLLAVTLAPFQEQHCPAFSTSPNSYNTSTSHLQILAQGTGAGSFALNSRWVTVPPFSGCYLRVINPHTGQVTLARYFNSQEHLLDLELPRALSDLKEGRVALLTSYHDTSGRLEGNALAVLHSLGSWAAPHLRFRDCWAWAWYVGGVTLAEALVTNPKGTSSVPPPLHLHLTLQPPNPGDRFCSGWPSGERWDKRRYFCDVYDGYSDLCSCSDPFLPSEKQEELPEDLPAVLVVAADRPRYLYRLLKQLLTQPDMTSRLVMVSVDGPHQETIRLLETLGLRYFVHAQEGTESSPRISRHVRFALFKALETFADTDKFIILEEDLRLAPDFYWFMRQTSVLLDEEEDSVYAVSAFSHLSSAHTARDLTRLVRVTYFPSCGWMTTRAFLVEILPKWPPVQVASDWDYWMGADLVRRGRELVLPEVSRTAHGGTTGSHTSSALARWYISKPLSSLPHTTLNLTAVRREAYEASLLRELQRARPLNVSDPYNLHVPLDQDGAVWVARVSMLHMEDSFAFRIIAQALGIWHADARDHHFGLWRIPYYNVIILIVGVPYSRYSSMVQTTGQIFHSTPAFHAQLLEESDKLEGMVFHQHNPDDFEDILDLKLKGKT
ncbi:protein O-linked-mannose beta-1,2-N-acetylglucosaminyltransferase 1-like [Panulirus ornatus]|uniref:protein O-linked-mannose beta-1,2-N-acetylglucosaminyltransferase 1-like n=1 Tax=Panulirus ornatus TaxID=150431 RepID=UPI003A85D959